MKVRESKAIGSTNSVLIKRSTLCLALEAALHGPPQGVKLPATRTPQDLSISKRGCALNILLAARRKRTENETSREGEHSCSHSRGDHCLQIMSMPHKCKNVRLRSKASNTIKHDQLVCLSEGKTGGWR